MAIDNGVLFQFFHWHRAADGTLWSELAAQAPRLATAGFTSVWLPPAGKGGGGGIDVGYGVYDLFDLGEFDQKGSVRTKYGTKAELLAAIGAAQAAGMQVYADVVFNHRDRADEKELVWGQPMDWDDRNRPVGPWEQFEAWTKFTFPGRGGRYSTFQWFWWCFDALSYNAFTQNASRLYRLKDRSFETEVSQEHGNYDYLLANDLDMGEDLVRGELKWWGEWFLKETGVDGFRIDAVKHIRSSWFPEWLGHVRGKAQGKELFAVGEYWSQDVDDLHLYLERTGGTLSLLDVPLHYRFHYASRAGSGFDMRTILDRTLMKEQPAKAVTFVDNHDTQPFESLFSPVEPWFKPHAYALILLRREGYPCVFYGDYYGATYKDTRQGGGPDVQLYDHSFLINRFLQARQGYGFGDQHDYFDHPNTIGWVRTGSHAHPGAMAVVMTNGGAGNKWMNTFKPGATFTDVTGHSGAQKVTTDGNGWGDFPCSAGSVSVWTQD